MGRFQIHALRVLEVRSQGASVEHLTNCHGEWLYLAQLLSALPFIGFWVQAKFQHKGHE